jgi:hypothetical protein
MTVVGLGHRGSSPDCLLVGGLKFADVCEGVPGEDRDRQGVRGQPVEQAGQGRASRACQGCRLLPQLPAFCLSCPVLSCRVVSNPPVFCLSNPFSVFCLVQGSFSSPLTCQPSPTCTHLEPRPPTPPAPRPAARIQTTTNCQHQTVVGSLVKGRRV